MAELPAHIKPLTGKALEAAKKQRAAHLLKLKKRPKRFIWRSNEGRYGP